MKNTLQSIVILTSIVVLLVSGRPSSNITRVYGNITSKPSNQKHVIKVHGNIEKVNRMIKKGWVLISVTNYLDKSRHVGDYNVEIFYLVKY